MYIIGREFVAEAMMRRMAHLFPGGSLLGHSTRRLRRPWAIFSTAGEGLVSNWSLDTIDGRA